MSADWTAARVVRDREGALWGRFGIIRWTPLVTMGTGAAFTAEEMRAEFGPLTPVLDAEGLPVVRTVGDLTARHIGRRVRVDGFEGKLEALLALFGGIVTVEVLTDDDLSAPRRCTIDAPVEVLP